MIIIRCKTESNREIEQLRDFILSQTAEDVVIVPNGCEVIYTDNLNAQVIIDDEEEPS